MTNLEKTILHEILQYLDRTTLTVLDKEVVFEESYCSVTFDYICNYVVNKSHSAPSSLIAVVLRNLCYSGDIRVGYCYDISELVFGCVNANWLQERRHTSGNEEIMIYDEGHEIVHKSELSDSCIHDLEFINNSYKEYVTAKKVLQS